MDVKEAVEEQKKYFAEHVATLTDLGNVKIIDFKKPKSNEYRIRFMFEEDYYRLHISGDLGELIATNYNNMCFKWFERDYVDDVGYFKEKVDCCSRHIYEFNYAIAFNELKERIEEYEWEDTILDGYESVYDFIDCVLEEYAQYSGGGISESGYELLSKIDYDAWEWAYDLGKESSGILELYLLAYKLAMQQLRERGVIE